MERFFPIAQWNTGARKAVATNAMAESPAADQELLRQLAKGNETAFTCLYERYQGPLFRFVLHMTGNRATAEEVTQEVFMLLIGKPKSYEADKGTVAGYLFGIARNVTRRIMQRSRLDLPIDDEAFNGHAEAALASDLDVLAELSNAELLEFLRKAVLALPEQYREVVALCDLEEMNYADAAAILECSPGTVASRLHRARAMLKTKLSWQKCTK
ncbi:MAG TPA: RNA polymerase sigma factor [Candidatus Angelobacter sp.]|nr:RNA polymerase sigma factor [Candidatus Angelobacter sp.]